jgi:hypothetical protein
MKKRVLKITAVCSLIMLLYCFVLISEWGNHKWCNLRRSRQVIYLGSLIINDNSVKKEIQRCILAGNRTYFVAISLFRSRLLYRANNIILYKTLIRPVVSYGAEVWALTKKEEQAVLIF